MSCGEFLCIYTPTYKRPFLRELCRTSVKNQMTPVHQVIVADHVGVGVDGMYAQIREHAHKVAGQYVMVLSDDNILLDADFSTDLEQEAEENDFPDVIVFKGKIETSVQPVAWKQEPVETMIDLSCFAVKRDIWVENADAWGHRYAGDFDFIHTLWSKGYRFHWWDRLAFQAIRISRGATE